jgi:hypothetical protein
MAASIAMLASYFFLASSIAAQESFDPGCPVPFGNLKTRPRPVDSCPVEGVGSNESQLAQNRQKNNLCVTTPAVAINQFTFTKLQAAVEQKGIAFGNTQHLPADRSVLRSVYTTTTKNTIGEGTRVAYVGYVLEAHPSDVSSGEDVNCKLHGAVNNDIHVTMAPTPTTALCQGIVAEIIPHSRPLAWEKISTMSHDHPFLIIGQLFFDASHEPCRPGKPTKPPRMSLWEIHPIYAIYVCKGTTPAECKAANRQAWVPLAAC